MRIGVQKRYALISISFGEANDFAIEGNFAFFFMKLPRMILTFHILLFSELIEAAQDMVLDLVGLDQEDELRRFLEIAAKQQVTGTKAIWYWKEDLNKIDAHNPSQVYQNSWIAYADSVVR